MLETAPINENNERILCQIGGKNSDMMMDIYVKYLKKGEEIEIFSKTNETAVLLTQGEVIIRWDENERVCKRESPFDMKPFCLHASRNTAFSVTALIDSELVFESTDNENEFPPVFYSPETCLYQEFGKDQLGGAGHRVVSTMFDPDNAPYSNMVLGEVFNKPGRWSSYPPHHHPQPEVYYYRFDKPQGFGVCFNGDVPYKSTDCSFSTITPGEVHEQVVAPGYNMYYVWMIRHLDGDKWYKTTRFVPEEHQWLTEAD